ncbi:MAG: hypothetical protein JWM36_3238 [Hyphomicrobiales bacterium]|nr:hypothetical protein [Hyphomicrobiales bacterium]
MITPTPTPTEIAVWTAQLTEAEAAYHAIQIGGQVTKIKLGDREVTTSAGSIAQLRIYINDLRSRLGLLPMVVAPRTRARRAVFL